MLAMQSAALAAGFPVMLRAGGAALLAPGLSEMPAGLRLVLAAGAAVIALPLGSGEAAPEGSWLAWAPGELMAGLCIGGIAAASAQALRWTGRVAGEQMGLALGGVAAPGDDSGEANAVESVMGWCAAATFVAVGGIEAVVLAAARSRAGVTGAWMASVRGWSGTLDAAMQVGLRACLPVLAVTLAGTAIGGVIMRAAPRAVTLAGGFGARAAMGLGMLAAGAGTAWALQTELVRGAIARLSQVGGA